MRAHCPCLIKVGSPRAGGRPERSGTEDDDGDGDGSKDESVENDGSIVWKNDESKIVYT